jgi:hypothetical protein
VLPFVREYERALFRGEACHPRGNDDPITEYAGERRSDIVRNANSDSVKNGFFPAS